MWVWPSVGLENSKIDPKHYDGMDDAVRESLMTVLKERGFEAITRNCRPTSQGDRSADDTLRPAVPHRHFLSTTVRHSANTEFYHMGAAASRDTTTY